MEQQIQVLSDYDLQAIQPMTGSLSFLMMKAKYRVYLGLNSVGTSNTINTTTYQRECAFNAHIPNSMSLKYKHTLLADERS